jgi:hypothetical protein
VSADAGNEADQVRDDEFLLRLNYSPEHIKDGEILPAAVALEDLKDRGFSVDREELVRIEIIIERAAGQQERSPAAREEAHLSRFQTGPVRSEVDHEQKPAFSVVASAIPGNAAHAHIVSAIPRGEGARRRLRSILLKHLNNLIALNTYASQKSG